MEAVLVKSFTRCDIFNEHHKYTLWTSGVQSIIIVVTYDKWEPVDKRWNCEGLGYRKVSSESIKQAFILHWNG